MTTEQIIIAFAGSLFLIVLTLLGYIAGRFTKNLDSVGSEIAKLRSELNTQLTSMGTTLRSIESDLRKELVALDRRIARIEGTGNRRKENGDNGGNHD